jgi:hypothetical protein
MGSDDEYVVLNGRRLSFKAAGLMNATMEDAAGSTGYLIPEDMLMVYDLKNQVSETARTEIVTTEVAPMTLSRFGILWPDDMQKPQSLLI